MIKGLSKNLQEKDIVVNSSSKYRQTQETLKQMTEQALKRTVWHFNSRELGGGMCTGNTCKRTDLLDRRAAGCVK